MMLLPAGTKYLLAALLSLLPLLARAELVFKDTTSEKTPSLEQTELEYTFPFKVTGDRPIRIKELRALCDCLHLKADRVGYQPGDSGTITARLQIGSFEGSIAKSFNVITDDPTQRRLLLRCVAQVPRLYEIAPLATTWKVGEEPLARTVVIKVLGDEPVRVTVVSATGKNVVPTFAAIEQGRAYKIILTPKSTDKAEAGMVKIETTSPVKKYATRFLYFNIIPPRGTPR